MNWIIEQDYFDPEKISENGNRFLTGNGYLGIRGTLDEFTKTELACINMAGRYDRVGDGWREPLNAPNPLYAYPVVDGIAYKVQDISPFSHFQKLDFRTGIFSRRTLWHTAKGALQIESERFPSRDDCHLMVMKYVITPDFDGEITLVTGVDGQVWDIYGPHFDRIDFYTIKDHITTFATTHEKGQVLCVEEEIVTDFRHYDVLEEEERSCLRHISFMAEAGNTYTMEKYCAIYVDEDEDCYAEAAENCVKNQSKCGYEQVKEAHVAAWDRIWAYSMVEIDGDEDAMIRLNYSLYHLHSIAPRHSDSMSIAARGLSGQTYKGAVFWDTEMFILDYFLFTEPKVARSLVKYRIDTLSGAMDKSASYGYKGAFYAWESQEGGFDACSDYNVTDVFTGRPMRTFFRDKQMHISAAVVYGLCRYVEISGDRSVLAEGGNRVIIECARFYYSLLLRKADSNFYHINDVIGPDEYHERVNDNGYTNRMAKYVFEQAVNILNQDDFRTYEEAERGLLLGQFTDAYRNIYIPEPDENGIIPQFQGYMDLEDAGISEVKSRLLHEKEYWGGAYGVASHTKVIKQADIVTWLTIFPEDFPEYILEANWNYYEPRTEHGSSLSACMYSMLACRFGIPDRAYPFFMKSASADYTGGGKEWAGLVYIGGTHPAAAGGAYMTAIRGFAGLDIKKGKPVCNPKLPSGWKTMDFHVQVLGVLYKVHIQGDLAEIAEIH